MNPVAQLEAVARDTHGFRPRFKKRAIGKDDKLRRKVVVNETKAKLRTNPGRLARGDGGDRQIGLQSALLETKLDISAIARLPQPVLVGLIHLAFAQHLTRSRALAVGGDILDTPLLHFNQMESKR